jgi:hypothetical protein
MTGGNITESDEGLDDAYNRRSTNLAVLIVVGWAVGEGAALIGAVIFYITGQRQWYGLGLLAMASSSALLSPGAASPTASGLDASG